MRPLGRVGALAAGLLLTAGCQQGPETAAELPCAIHEAHGLEAALHAEPGRFGSYDAVLAHYRRRFGEEIARRQAAYSWDSSTSRLRPGDISMEPPETVVVLAAGADTAVVAYHTPAVLQELWGLERYTVERLQLENGHWIVVESSPTGTRPVGLPDRTT